MVDSIDNNIILQMKKGGKAKDSTKKPKTDTLDTDTPTKSTKISLNFNALGNEEDEEEQKRKPTPSTKKSSSKKKTTKSDSKDLIIYTL